MKVLKSLLTVALALPISIGTSANSHLDHKLELAFHDAAAILEKPGTCSEFFGGRKSTHVLNELAVRLQTRSNDYRIAFRMSGQFVVHKNDSGVLYRLFDNAEVNRTGAFYKAKVFPSEPLVPNVGRFRPNTREARVLILLHELAHLIEGSDGNWLIPDDGNDPVLSRSNTRTIEEKCREEIITNSEISKHE